MAGVQKVASGRRAADLQLGYDELLRANNMNFIRLPEDRRAVPQSNRVRREHRLACTGQCNAFCTTKKNTLLQFYNFPEYNYLFGISNLAVPENNPSNWQSQLSSRSSSVYSESVCIASASSSGFCREELAGINYPEFLESSSGFRFRQSRSEVTCGSSPGNFVS